MGEEHVRQNGACTGLRQECVGTFKELRREPAAELSDGGREKQ